MNTDNIFSGYTITEDQVAEIIFGICRNSYVILDSLLPADITAAALSEINDLNEAAEPGEDLGSIRQGNIVVKSPLLQQIMCHPLVLAVWETYLGLDFSCSTFTSNTVLPNGGCIGWHVDYPYWGMQQPWLTGRLGGQSLWALDDFTTANGATGAVPGSHTMGCPPDNPKDWRDDAKILEAPAGSLILADGAWYHTARPNTTEQSRSCLLAMYLKDILVMQEDILDQLSQIKNPSETVHRIMGGDRRVPGTVGEY
ncbi:phytanoyl-CoA dioxygenase family protein [bacterium AH-315-E10]|nr:phytanoyl-CoA dioxygenase family protein [bacterium AH-315-E10]